MRIILNHAETRVEPVLYDGDFDIRWYIFVGVKNIGGQSRAEIDFFAVHHSLPILRKVLAQNQFTRLVIKLVIAIVVVRPAKAFGPAHICFNIIIVGQEKIYVLLEQVRGVPKSPI